MATTSSNPTVTGTPISNSNNESPATLQRKLIVLTFNLLPIEDQITVAIDSVDEITFTNPDGTTSTDYLIIVKIIQNLSYCTRSLVGYTVPANATSVKDGDTEIYLRRDDLETKLKSQVDSYRIMFESKTIIWKIQRFISICKRKLPRKCYRREI